MIQTADQPLDERRLTLAVALDEVPTLDVVWLDDIANISPFRETVRKAAKVEPTEIMAKGSWLTELMVPSNADRPVIVIGGLTSTEKADRPVVNRAREQILGLNRKVILVEPSSQEAELSDDFRHLLNVATSYHLRKQDWTLDLSPSLQFLAEMAKCDEIALPHAEQVEKQERFTATPAGASRMTFTPRNFAPSLTERVTRVLANLAYEAAGRGQEEYPVSDQERFTPVVYNRLADYLSIDVGKSNCQQFFQQLFEELMQAAKNHELDASWGSLRERPTGLVFKVQPLRRNKADRPRARLITENSTPE